MKITKLEIKNFRNIKDKVYEFKDNTSILAGKNGLGKSNSLNALMWVLSGTLLTDNYGVGENDIDSIVPNDHSKGIHTEVAITFEKGQKFSKRYKTAFSRETKKVNGHVTEWLINDVLQKNESTFLVELYKQFDYMPSTLNLSVRELNLFIDPLYALQKLEAKALRELLVSLGCSVTNEELYASGFQELQQYEATYLGKWDIMRIDLNKKIKAFEKEIESLDSKLETVAEVGEFKEEAITKLNQEKEKLIAKKLALQSEYQNEAVKEVDMEIKNLRISKEASIQKDLAGIEAEIKILSEKKLLAESQIQMETSNRTKDVDTEINRLENEAKDLGRTISLNNFRIDSLKQTIVSNLNLIKQLSTDKSNLSIKFSEASGRTFTNYITCPECGTNFVANEEDITNFNRQKDEDLTSIKNDIESIKAKVAKLQGEVQNSDEKSSKLKTEIEEAKAQKVELENKILELKKQVANLVSEPVDRSKIFELENEITKQQIAKENVANKYTDIDVQINNLVAKKEALLTQNQEALMEEQKAIDNELVELEGDISNAYVWLSKWRDKQGYLATQEANIKALNETESLYAKVDKFIKTMISKINQKATAKLGLEFTMLEENISNAGLKEVCYATVDGVEFRNINTAEKLKLGIKFIERVKDICVSEFKTTRNTLPILADRLEGIDEIEKVKNLTKEQFICTRVSLDSEIQIL